MGTSACTRIEIHDNSLVQRPNMNLRTLSLLLILASGVLQGCPASTYQLNQLPSSSPLPQAVPIAASDDYVHTPSRYVFPVAVAHFQRVALMRYDTGGLDVSAGYNGGRPGCPVALTVYLSPAPRMSLVGADPAAVHSLEARWLSSAYEQWKAEIAHEHPQARLVQEDARVQAGVPGKKAVYAIGDDQSELFVFLEGQAWFMSYRMSFPASCSTEAHAELSGFFDGWSGHPQ
jgi:hypothetical protein